MRSLLSGWINDLVVESAVEILKKLKSIILMIRLTGADAGVVPVVVAEAAG